jgi:hypothetical protein
MAEILEGLESWRATFQSGWLAHVEATGQTDFKQYVRPRNIDAPAGPAIDLTRSRLIVISSAGAYLSATQSPFDAENLLGDYTVRTFPQTTDFADLAIAHTHYDHAAINADPQVLLPLRHLEQLQAAGEIGELARAVISFGGYQPDAAQVVTALVPPVVELVLKEAAHAALLVPA